MVDEEEREDFDGFGGRTSPAFACAVRERMDLDAEDIGLEGPIALCRVRRVPFSNSTKLLPGRMLISIDFKAILMGFVMGLGEEVVILI